MRKEIIKPSTPASTFDEKNWLDLGTKARAEISSEDPEHPIEAALTAGKSGGWRAAESGKQTIRIILDEPQRVQRVHLEFYDASGAERTQEFSLTAILAGANGRKEIVRQQFNFHSGSTSEIENYNVNLDHVSGLELVIVPDQNGGSARATLAKLRLA